MTEQARLDSIIAKARLIRQSTAITPIEMVLSDLIEALALALQAHDSAGAHVRAIGGGSLPGLPIGMFGTPYHDIHFKEQS